jgi:5-methylcytosine-specific restriction endonuclease McrA
MAMSKSNDPRLTKDYKRIRLQVLARDGFTCYYCGAEDKHMTVDHIIPIVKGGDPIAMDNMVTACKPCNSAKGSRSQGVFLQRSVTPPVFPTFLSPMRSTIQQDSPFTSRPEPESNR